MFGPLGGTVIIAMACSLVVSLMITPALCQILLTREDRAREKGGTLLPWLKRHYRPLLERILGRRKSAIVSALAAVLIAVSLIPFMGKEFLPVMDEGTFTLSANVLPGASLDESRRMAHQIEQALLEIPEVTSVGSRTGRAERDEHVHGVFANEILVHVLPPEKRNKSRAELLEEMREKLSRFPGMLISISQPIAHRLDHILSGVLAQLAIKLFGPDLHTLRSKAEEIRAVLSTVEGVVDLKVEEQVVIPQLAIHIKRDVAARLGLSVGDISDFIHTALEGEAVSQIIQGQRRYDLLVRVAEEHRRDIEKIRNLRMSTPNGARVPLRSVADVRYEKGANTINRENVSRRIVIQCNVAGRDLGSAVEEIRERISQQVDLPGGYFVTKTFRFFHRGV